MKKDNSNIDVVFGVADKVASNHEDNRIVDISKFRLVKSQVWVSYALLKDGFKFYPWYFINHKYKGFIYGGIILILFLLFTLIARITVVSPGNGVITGGDDQIQIISPASGFVNNFNLSSGNSVKQDQVLFSFTNLDVFYQEKSIKEILDTNKQELDKIKLDVDLLYTLNKGVGIEIVNKLLKENAEISNISNDINKSNKKLSKKSEISSSITENNLKNNNEVKLKEDNATTLLAENSSRLDLNYYKFKTEYDALKDETDSFFIRTALFQQEKKGYEYQLSIYLRKADLLTRSKSPEVDILENNANINRTRLSLISAENIYINLADKLKANERDFFSRLYQKLQELNERIITLNKEILEKQGQLVLLEQKLDFSSVKSPVNGTILKIEKPLTAGSFIESNQVILTIKRENEEAIIRSRFDAKYRPFIHVGGSVEIVVDSPGYRRTMRGKITRISDDSFARDNTANKSSLGSEQRYYSVDIKPDVNSDFSGLYEGIEARIYAQSTSISIFTYMTALFNKGPVFNVW